LPCPSSASGSTLLLPLSRQGTVALGLLPLLFAIGTFRFKFNFDRFSTLFRGQRLQLFLDFVEKLLFISINRSIKLWVAGGALLLKTNKLTVFVDRSESLFYTCCRQGASIFFIPNSTESRAIASLFL
jgi:hypothetical protein